MKHMTVHSPSAFAAEYCTLRQTHAPSQPVYSKAGLVRGGSAQQVFL